MSERNDDRTDFIRSIIRDDLERGKYRSTVTRFPPEPNGYLHIGHSKAICLNFGVANQFGGVCHLRFDDTNPAKEDMEYVEAIKRDIAWLGFDWKDKLFFASDYYAKIFGYAIELIESGKAYVDSLTKEQIREYRGSLTEPGTNSPYRDRTIAENLDLFTRMRSGEFSEGAHVLRAKIDMSHPNILMRDPAIYRIKQHDHYRTGNAWCVYPMYDFAHCISDAIEQITHSLCSLEFENHRPLYDWVLDNISIASHPQQIEFARLNIGYTVMSKRKLLQLVNDRLVDGWDDPRMPTLAGMRRRGITPEAIRRFSEMVGVAKYNSLVDIEKFEHCVRDDLNHRAPRVMCVSNPLKVTITNYPSKRVENLEAASFPKDVGTEGSRLVPFSKQLYIERDDFMVDAPKKFYRLAPGREVRLRYAYVIKCEKVITSDDGEVVELLCTADLETLGTKPEGRKVKGTIHWVSAQHALKAELRLYDRLFTAERPDAAGDFKDVINPDSKIINGGALIEPSVASVSSGARFQFERLGYFCVDLDSAHDALVFNRTIELRDSWSKSKTEPAQVYREQKTKPADKPIKSLPVKAVRVQRSPELQMREAEFVTQGLSKNAADLLTRTTEIADYFEAAAKGTSAAAVGKWLASEGLRELKNADLSTLRFAPSAIGELVALISARTISKRAGQTIFKTMLQDGGNPEELVDSLGLRQNSDADDLRQLAERLVAEFPDKAAEYRGGKTNLMGFFVGQLMRRTSGAADPRLANQLLGELLAG